MQALTPEQAKMFWSTVGEIGKWVVSAITLAVLAWVGRTVRAFPDRINAPVLAKLEDHEAKDLAFQVEIREYLKLPSPDDPHPHQRARHAHGD